MKLSCVAFSVSAVALTASAASVPASPYSPRIAIRFGNKSKFLSHDDVENPSTQSHHERRNVGEGRPGNNTPTPRAPLVFMMKRAKTLRKMAQEASPNFNERPLPSVDALYEYELTHPLRNSATTQSIGSISKSGVPGFIEVAIPNPNSGPARSVSRLVHLTKPAAGGAVFDLGTSPSHSTQFFMSAVNGTDGSSLYRLSVPILDSTTFETTDYCATFSISSPGPLSLQKCRPTTGTSQNFFYDRTSGKLQPVYTPSGTGLLTGSRLNVLPLTRDSDRSSKFHPIKGNSRTASAVVSKSQAPIESNTSSASTASPALYFVPAESFQKPSSYTSDVPNLPL